MIDQNCAYCVEGELVDAFGIQDLRTADFQGIFI